MGNSATAEVMLLEEIKKRQTQEEEKQPDKSQPLTVGVSSIRITHKSAVPPKLLSTPPPKEQPWSALTPLWVKQPQGWVDTRKSEAMELEEAKPTPAIVIDPTLKAKTDAIERRTAEVEEKLHNLSQKEQGPDADKQNELNIRAEALEEKFAQLTSQLAAQNTTNELRFQGIEAAVTETAAQTTKVGETVEELRTGATQQNEKLDTILALLKENDGKRARVS